MKLKTFQLGMRAITGVMPYAKKMQDDELSFLFLLLPEQVRADVSDSMWAAAISKYMEEKPSDDIAVHMKILSYVYRNENGKPNFDWGMKDEIKALLDSAPDLKELPDAE